MKITPHPGMPSKEQMRRWREGHRQMNRDARQERLQLTYEQRLDTLEKLYHFLKSLERLGRVHTDRPECIRWVRYKQKWMQENQS